MKKIFRAFLATVLAFGSTAVFAQSVKFDKTISGPSDEGVYTINLEAYVTGAIEVTKTPAPADIILVLDQSGSMRYNVSGGTASSDEERRINILKDAVKAFVDTTKASSARIKPSDKDDFGGHRIAIIWFSEEVNTSITGLNQFINVEGLQTVASYRRNAWSTYHAAQVNYNNSNLIGVNPDAGTYSQLGMQRAKTLLSSQSYGDKPKRSRVVVFFTDGQPGSGQHNDNWPNWSDDLKVANDCIKAANDIKTSTAYAATVYSVGMFNKTATTVDATTTYLAYTSSDFTGKTAMPSSSNYVPVSQDKSIIVSSAGALANVFDSISQSSGGEYTAASSSSVLVDIVTSSFYIPKDADLGNVEVYKVACTKASATAITSFETDESKWDPITDDVDLDVDKDTGEVCVTNFDYGAEWCGWDASKNEPHGQKMVLKIPILADRKEHTSELQTR